MKHEVDPLATQAEENAPDADESEGDGWTIQEGKVSQGEGREAFRPDGIEGLTYNNPYGQGLERVWFDGKICFALDAGELEIEQAGEVKVAREYQCVHSVELDEKGKLKSKKEVEGQFNIYDSVPGMEEYSPIWQFHYVVVPPDYEPNSFRSADDCQQSGYTIHKSNVFEN